MEQGGEPLRTFSAAELEILNALPVVMYLADWKEGQKRIAWANKVSLKRFPVTFHRLSSVRFHDPMSGADLGFAATRQVWDSWEDRIWMN